MTHPLFWVHYCPCFLWYIIYSWSKALEEERRKTFSKQGVIGWGMRGKTFVWQFSTHAEEAAPMSSWAIARRQSARSFSDDASHTFQWADENPGPKAFSRSLNLASAKLLSRECQTVNYAPAPLKKLEKFFPWCIIAPCPPSQITGSVSLYTKLASQLRSAHSTLLTFRQHRFGGQSCVTSHCPIHSQWRTAIIP